jgi:pimeloyl-ACP methyl ester carboxylesterase
MLKIINRLITAKLSRSGFTSHFVKVGQAEVHYYAKPVANSKSTIVLVHGIASSAGHFHEILPMLSQSGHSILAVDLPGHGQSSELDSEMDPDTLFIAFEKLLDKIAPQKFTLVGNSMGGAISLRYASEHPERIESLILASPSVGFENEDDWMKLKSLLKIDTPQKAEKFLKILFHRPPIGLRIFRYFLFQAVTRKGVQELVERTKFSDLQPAPGLKLYAGPTLLIWGQSEVLFPKSNLSWIRSKLHRETVYEEPAEVGHCPQFDSPKWFAKRIVDFVDARN